MDRAPVEIIERICSSLCLHCQSPSDCLLAAGSETDQAKATLASFSATCSFIRAAVQPILFHYFSAGNTPNFHSPTDYKLALFLRSVIERPDLALCVRFLQLPETTPRPFRGGGLNTPLLTILNEASRRLGLGDGDMIPPTEAAWQKVLFPGGNWSHVPAILISRQQDEVSIRMGHWLQELALMLLPSVSSLLVTRTGPRTKYFCFAKNAIVLGPQGRTTLTSLKQATLLGDGFDDWHIVHAASLLEASPNLEELRALDCGFDRAEPGEDTFVYPNRPWKLPMAANLRILTITNITLEELKRSLAICPRLEELDYRKSKMTNYYTTNEARVFCRQPVEAVLPVAKTLRTLHIGFRTQTCFREPRGVRPSLVPESYEELLLQDIFHPIASFQHFEQLHTLSIEQAALVYPTDGEYEPRLVDILPASIRVFRLIFIYRGFREDMERLLAEAPLRFPRLERVELGVVKPVSDTFYELVANDVGTVSKMFKGSGIRLALGCLMVTPDSVFEEWEEQELQGTQMATAPSQRS
ncbi:hypothetical protein B0T14DRAFT_531750 [Immersiella caudata]|uniref:F-box domain-containing protein n=1 Tax=Immersiella caudata TaxID=314043 RepID=A0AA39U4D1_9PEZI|nr:hypothetical protein B0T14DRAFT_531750 [Immersiella caudata]